MRRNPGAAPLRLAAVMLAALILSGCAGAVQQAGLAGKDSLPALLRVAEKNANAGNHSMAAQLYRSAQQRYPEAAAPSAGLGRELYHLGAFGKSAEAFRTALELDPSLAEARYGLGKSLLALDRSEAARRVFVELTRQAPQNLHGHLGLGVALDMLDRHREAQAEYRRGLQFDPRHLGLRNNLGLSLALAGDHEQAIGVLRLLAGEPGATSRVRQNLALAYGLAGRHEAAAAVASVDLDDRAVEANLAYYRTIARMSGAGGEPAVDATDADGSDQARRPEAEAPDPTNSADTAAVGTLDDASSQPRKAAARPDPDVARDDPNDGTAMLTYKADGAESAAAPAKHGSMREERSAVPSATGGPAGDRPMPLWNEGNEAEAAVPAQEPAVAKAASPRPATAGPAVVPLPTGAVWTPRSSNGHPAETDALTGLSFARSDLKLPVPE